MDSSPRTHSSGKRLSSVSRTLRRSSETLRTVLSKGRCRDLSEAQRAYTNPHGGRGDPALRPDRVRNPILTRKWLFARGKCLLKI